MATLFDENRLEAEIDSKVKTIVKNELSKESVHRATVLRKDSSGIWWVRLDGGEETPVLVNKVDMSVGDIVTVTLRDNVTYADGNITSPALSASNSAAYVDEVVAKNVRAVNANIDYLKADVATIGYAQIEDAEITNARIYNLTYEVVQNVTRIAAAEANIVSLSAQTAKIQNLTAEELEATVGYIQDLEAENISASDIVSDHADIASLDSHYAHITDGVIDNATIGHANVNGLSANYADIGLANVDTAAIDHGVIRDASITSAKIGDAQITTAKIQDAAVTSAKIGSAAVGTAQIQQAAITTALIADEAVGDSKIASVSANKLTAGTIDAGKINVANLNAKNLIVEKINGQPVLGGMELVSPNSTGYSSKNPVNEGWYELVNGSFVLSSDTEVDDSKAYYRSGTATRLYDQDYINALETSLGDRIDGAIETFTADAVPTLSNYPASDWTSSDYASHVGDVCYVLNPQAQANGYCYRFAYDTTNEVYEWVLIKDSDVTAALQRLVDAEGDISGLQSFQTSTQTWITNTDTEIGSLQSAQTSLTTRVTNAENAIETKVDTQTFNSVSNTVDSHTQTIQSMSTTVQTASANASNALTAANNAVQTANDVPIVTLSSTNGTVFKRNLGVSTTIVATIFTPGGRIDNITDLRSRFGNGAYLEWGWRDVVTDADHVLVSSDERIGNGGFTLTVDPDDIDTQAVITCSLNY